MLNLIKNDPWLEPYNDAIEGRYIDVKKRKESITDGGKISLSDFASGYLYFGLHKTN